MAPNKPNPAASEIELYLETFRQNPRSMVFGPLAEAYIKGGRLQEAVEVCQKGLLSHPDFVEGRLRFDSWERDGQKRSRLTVVAESFQFLDGGSGGQSSGFSPSSDASGDDEPAGARPYTRQSAHASAGRASAGQTPQDDYGEAADDIPF